MKIIYYYHIPKCGGTTIKNKLKRLANDLNGEFYNFSTPMKRFGFSRELINNYKLRRFLKNINRKTSEYKFVHHHHGFYGLSEIQNHLLREKQKAKSFGNEFHLFTCIREPLSFQISLVNFLRNSCGMPTMSFDDACHKPLHHNVMYKYFLYNHSLRWKVIDLDKDFFMKNLSVVDRVFFLEEFNDLHDWLAEILSANIRNSDKKANVGAHKISPNEEQIKVLRQANTLDQLFYDTAKTFKKSI